MPKKKAFDAEYRVERRQKSKQDKLGLLRTMWQQKREERKRQNKTKPLLSTDLC